MDFWRDPEISGNLIATGLLVVGAVALRMAAKRAIGRAHLASEQVRLRWVVVTRNVTVALLLVGSAVIWASQIESVALSIVAFAAALVLATKELILCVSGAVLRAGSGAYSVGDRVELGAARGDVIDISLLTTTLLEVGPGHQRTGRSITVPNSALITGLVVNETFMDEYVVHVVKVPLDPRRVDWDDAESALLAAGRAACEEHLDAARRFMDAQSRKHGLPNISVEPRVHVTIEGPDEIHLLLRVPTPVRERGRVEQEVFRAYLAHAHDSPDPPPAPEPPEA